MVPRHFFQSQLVLIKTKPYKIKTYLNILLNVLASFRATKYQNQPCSILPLLIVIFKVKPSSVANSKHPVINCCVSTDYILLLLNSGLSFPFLASYFVIHYKHLKPTASVITTTVIASRKFWLLHHIFVTQTHQTTKNVSFMRFPDTYLNCKVKMMAATLLLYPTC